MNYYPLNEVYVTLIVKQIVTHLSWPCQARYSWNDFKWKQWQLVCKIQGVPELLCQMFMLITRLFFELETWNLGLMQSIMGHLIIKNEFDHYHLLDIPNDCVKKFKDFRRFTAKNMAISHSWRRIPQNWPKTLIKGCCLG